MKDEKPRIVLQDGNLTLIQAGVKNWVFLFDLVFIASLTAYEAEE